MSASMPLSERLNRAAEAGIISSAQAGRLAEFLAETPADAAPEAGDMPDTEAVRFARGFHDVFLTIGIVILLVGTSLVAGFAVGHFGAAAGAIVAWGLAEHYTRRKRLVLPSLALALGFVVLSAVSIGFFSDSLLMTDGPNDARDIFAFGLLAAGTGLAAAIAFRFRFGLPFASGLVAASLAAFLISALLYLMPDTGSGVLRALSLLLGAGVFATAMSFDLSDRYRQTLRADNAFWLHIVAAPLLIHGSIGPIETLGDAGTGAGGALIVIGVLVLLALVAVAIDRRALIVGGLVYFGVAIATLLRTTEVDVGLVTALTLTLLGAGVVLIGTNWHQTRRAIVSRLVPANIARRLPPLVTDGP